MLQRNQSFCPMVSFFSLSFGSNRRITKSQCKLVRILFIHDLKPEHCTASLRTFPGQSGQDHAEFPGRLGPLPTRSPDGARRLATLSWTGAETASTSMLKAQWPHDFPMTRGNTMRLLCHPLPPATAGPSKNTPCPTANTFPPGLKDPQERGSRPVPAHAARDPDPGRAQAPRQLRGRGP